MLVSLSLLKHCWQKTLFFKELKVCKRFTKDKMILKKLITRSFIALNNNNSQGTRVEKWWEYLPPTNVSWVQILASRCHRMLSLWLVLSLSPRGFTMYSTLFPSPQTQHFQFQYDQGLYTKNLYVDVLPLNCYLFIIFLFTYMYDMYMTVCLPQRYPSGYMVAPFSFPEHGYSSRAE